MLKRSLRARFAIPLALLSTSILLSSCATSEASLPETSKGIDGNDISTLVKLSQLSEGDVWMQKVCSNIQTYETGIEASINNQPDGFVPENDRKRRLVIAETILKARELEKYPQYEMYRTGIEEKIADEKASSQKYQILKYACTAYIKLDLSLKNNYVDPLLVTAGCWQSDDPSSIGAKLQENVAGEWVTLESQTNLFQVGFCGPDYPLGASFSIERSKADLEDRTVRVAWAPLKGGNLDGRTDEYFTCSQTFGLGDSLELGFGTSSCDDS